MSLDNPFPWFQVTKEAQLIEQEQVKENYSIFQVNMSFLCRLTQNNVKINLEGEKKLAFKAVGGFQAKLHFERELECKLSLGEMLALTACNSLISVLSKYRKNHFNTHSLTFTH